MLYLHYFLDTLQVLQDIQSLSQRHPQVLLSILNDLKNLLTSSSGKIRSLAISLIIQSLSAGKEGEEEIVSTLFESSKSLDIATSTVMEKLPDIVSVLKSK